MQMDIFASGWLPQTPLEWFFAVAAVCSIGMGLKALWSFVRRAWRELIFQFRLSITVQQLQQLIDELKHVRDFTLHPQRLTASALDDISRMLGLLAILYFITLLVDEWFLRVILGTGPFLGLLNIGSRLSLRMRTLSDPAKATERRIRTVERLIDRLDQNDPDQADLAAKMTERLDNLKKLAEDFRHLDQLITGKTGNDKIITIDEKPKQETRD